MKLIFEDRIKIGKCDVFMRNKIETKLTLIGMICEEYLIYPSR